MKYLTTKQSIVEVVTEFIKSGDSLMFVLTRDSETIVKEFAQEIFNTHYGTGYKTTRVVDDLPPKFHGIIIGCYPEPNEIPQLISLYKSCERKILVIIPLLHEKQITDIEKQYESQVLLCYQRNDIECWQTWAEVHELHPLICNFIKKNGPDMISGYSGQHPHYYSDYWRDISKEIKNWEKTRIDNDEDYQFRFDIDSVVETYRLPQEFKEYFISQYSKTSMGM